ncbi:MAG: LOW QUALITY PROTEIN: hypothetical protein KVP17_000874 [Porospora cf. gigantea B]|uniref:uncharacterized protein n=1 Tax=Porospora cf. gigantea B TaxID=2853592 RepID=UPI003571D1DA|nr:MAG: LOW QUALITY PROTEIN: hypothetical protein KVP17_000874 [Porospora cf. gigantea B]
MFNTKVATLAASITDQKTAEKALTEDRRDLRHAVKEATSLLEEVQRELDKVMIEKKELLKVKMQVDSDARSREEERTTLDRRRAELDEACGRFEASQAALNEDAETVRVEREEVEAQRRDLEDLRVQVTEFQALVAEQTRALQEQGERVQSQACANDDARMAAEALSRTTEKKANELSQKDLALEAREADLRRKRTELTDRLKVAQDDCDRLNADALERQRSLMEETTQEIERMREAFEAERLHRTGDEMKRLAEWEADLATREADLDQEREDLEKQVNTLTSDFDALKEEHRSEMSAAFAQLEGSGSALRKSREQLLAWRKAEANKLAKALAAVRAREESSRGPGLADQAEAVIVRVERRITMAEDATAEAIQEVQRVSEVRSLAAEELNITAEQLKHICKQKSESSERLKNADDLETRLRRQQAELNLRWQMLEKEELRNEWYCEVLKESQDKERHFELVQHELDCQRSMIDASPADVTQENREFLSAKRAEFDRKSDLIRTELDRRAAELTSRETVVTRRERAAESRLRAQEIDLKPSLLKRVRSLDKESGRSRGVSSIFRSRTLSASPAGLSPSEPPKEDEEATEKRSATVLPADLGDSGPLIEPRTEPVSLSRLPAFLLNRHPRREEASLLRVSKPEWALIT